MLRRNLFVAAAAAALAAGPGARAATLYVSTTGNNQNPGTQAQPKRSVQAGVDAAQPGDTVLVADGTYTPDGYLLVRISNKDITLKSLGGPGKCILDDTGRGGRVMEISGVSANCVVDGFTMKGGNISAALGGWGGGLLITNAGPAVRNCYFDGNTAANDGGNAVGGGVFVNGGDPTFQDCRITNNTARSSSGDAFGGGMATSSSNIRLIRCTVSGNQAVTGGKQASGGGLAFDGSGQPGLVRCTVSDNSATSTAGAAGLAYGGGVWTQSGLDCSRTTLAGNSAACDGGIGAGGGLYALQGCALDRSAVTDNAITGLPTTAFGVGIYAVGGTCTLTDCSITDNKLANVQQAAYGGGIGITGLVTATLTRCDIARNVLHSDKTDFQSGAGLAGGGVSSFGTLRMYGCSLTENIVNATGSGICKGGGYAQVAGTAGLFNTLILGNQAQGDRYTTQGGGACVIGGTLTLANALVVANRVSGYNNGTGGGLYAHGSGVSAALVNCAFTKNSVDTGVDASAGGAVSCWNSATVTAANCIFRDDSAPSRPEIGTYSGTVKVSYSDVQGGIPGGVTNDGHNTDADPRFVRAALTNGATDYGDLHLNAGSPGINAGNAAASGLPAYDLDGYKRVQGGAPDMGAYEYRVDGGPAYDLYVDIASGNDGNSGTAGSPLKTITQALARIQPPGRAVIHVKQGNYGGDHPHVDGPVRFENWTATGRASLGKP